MKPRRVAAVALSLSMWTSPSRAQDQSLSLSPELKACPAVTLKEAQLDKTADAEALLSTVIGGAAITADTFYVIHLAKVNDTKLAFDSQNWYVYHKSWASKTSWLKLLVDPRLNSHLTSARIFGSHNVTFVSVFIGMPGVDVSALRTLKAAATNPGDANLDAWLNAARAHDVAKLAMITPVTPSGVKLAAFNDALLVPDAYQSLNAIVYQIDVTKREATPITNLKTGLTLVGQAGPAAAKIELQPTPMSVCGYKTAYIAPLPSDMSVTVQVSGLAQDAKLTKQSFRNEKKYYYDFSVALPFKSTSEVTLKSDGTVAPTSVKKNSLFGVLNLSPVAYDLDNSQLQLIPRLIYGVSLTGAPLQHQLVGGAVGFNFLQLIAGVRFDQKRIETAATSTQPATSEKTWERSFTLGLNLSVKAVADALGAGGKGSSGGDASTAPATKKK